MKIRLASLFAAVFLFVAASGPSFATPSRGAIPWNFIACTYSDTGTPALSMAQLRTKILGTGVGSLADWIHDTSNGVANLSAASLHGYYRIPETQAQSNANKDWKSACLAAAKTGTRTVPAFSPASDAGLTVLTAPSLAAYGSLKNSLNGVGDPLGEIAHEFSHGLGLEHSWSNDYASYVNQCASKKYPNGDPNYTGGDYDNQWDELSWNAHGMYTATRAPQNTYTGGPGLDGYHLDQVGWIPMNRIVTAGADGRQSSTIALAPLNHPEVPGAMLIRVPIDPHDPYHYYTVEYFTPDGWESGIPASPPQLLINEIVQPSVANARHLQTPSCSWPTWYTSYLQRSLGAYLGKGNGPPVQFVQGPGYTVAFKSLSGKQMQVSVVDTAVSKTLASTVYGPNTCKSPYVWREADELDYVCVTPDIRRAARADNAAAPSRHLPGSNTCVQGYVWREAFAGDYVCVPGSTRTQARNDNAATGRYVM